MSEIKNLTKKLIEFRDKRDWKQFHNSKDLSLAISIESAELNELFLWKKDDEVETEAIKEELADILCFALLLAEKHNLDVSQIVQEKISENEKKYPIEKAKGIATKYTNL